MATKKAKKKTDKELAVGRIVHFVFKGLPQAAIVSTVTDEENNIANLFVLIDAKGLNYSTFHPNVKYSDKWEDFTWHWPTDEKPEETKVEGTIPVETAE